MATVTDRESATSTKNVVTFLLALFVLLSIVIAVASCGDDDLIFPGDIPSPTSGPTDTPDPDDEDDTP